MSFQVCRHIKMGGLQCESPALRKDKFCYYHTTLRRRHQSLLTKPDVRTLQPTGDSDGKLEGMEPPAEPWGSIELGLLEDCASVQVAISTVVNALATNRLDVRRATALLYGLQIAAGNSRTMDKAMAPSADEMIRETKHDSDGEPIAAPKLNSDTASDFVRSALERYGKRAQPNLHREGNAAVDGRLA